jgi:hypothetical protein
MDMCWRYRHYTIICCWYILISQIYANNYILFYYALIFLHGCTSIITKFETYNHINIYLSITCA